MPQTLPQRAQQTPATWGEATDFKADRSLSPATQLQTPGIDLQLVRELCHRVGLIVDGRIVATGGAAISSATLA